MPQYIMNLSELVSYVVLLKNKKNKLLKGKLMNIKRLSILTILTSTLMIAAEY